MAARWAPARAGCGPDSGWGRRREDPWGRGPGPSRRKPASGVGKGRRLGGGGRVHSKHIVQARKCIYIGSPLHARSVNTARSPGRTPPTCTGVSRVAWRGSHRYTHVCHHTQPQAQVHTPLWSHTGSHNRYRRIISKTNPRLLRLAQACTHMCGHTQPTFPAFPVLTLWKKLWKGN